MPNGKLTWTEWQNLIKQHQTKGVKYEIQKLRFRSNDIKYKL